MIHNYIRQYLPLKFTFSKTLKPLLLLFLLGSGSFFTQAQGLKVTGTTFDSTNNKSLTNAVIMINRASDSVMAGFTRSGSNGNFQLSGLKPGKYIVMVTYPEYADYLDTFTLYPNKDKNLGGMNMIQLSQVMQSILITAYKGAIRMKGDTTEFVADSFKTKQGANVEDLLKKLPGVQVNKNGEVIAQGKKVEKILVDGEEFFGDDPTIATKNLDAKSVDVVKVYDTKTDDAKASGVDDGTRVKVMDIKLKEANKKGYFGSISAGHGEGKDFPNLIDGIHEVRGMVNAFTEKRKISAYAMAVNSPNVGLSWEENESYGSGNNRQYDPESGSTYSYSSNDDMNYWLNYTSGLPTSSDAGLVYNNKFFNKKLSLNSSYVFKNLTLNSLEKTNTTTVTRERVINQSSSQNVMNNRIRHAVKLKNEWALDSLTTLRVSVNGSTSAINTTTTYKLASQYNEGVKLNEQLRYIGLTGNNNKMDWNSSYRHRSAKKPGRYYNLSYSGNLGATISNSKISSMNTLFYDSGKINFLQLTNQKKNQNLSNGKHAISALYNEPLNKRWSLAVSVNENYSSNISQKYTFDNSGNFERIDSLSSNADYSINNSSAGLILKYKRKKIDFSVQNFVSRVVMSQNEVIRNYTFKKPYINTLPGMSFGYARNKQSRINFNYNLNINQPQAQQIQPLIDNTNPLQLQLGNPNLRQELSHNLNLMLNDGKVLTSRWLWTNIYASFTQHALTQRSYIDSFGKTISQTINVDGNYNIGSYMGYYKALGKSPFSLNVNYQPSVSRQKTFINNLASTTHSQSHRASLGLDASLGEATEANLEFTHTQNFSRNSLNSLKNNNWTQTISFSFETQLPKGFSFSVNMDANRRQKTAIYKSNVNNTLITSEIGKSFFKDKRLLFTFGVYDLLNQNIGYNRSVYNNVISENQFNTFTRFFYGKIVYKFKNKVRTGEGEANQ